MEKEKRERYITMFVSCMYLTVNIDTYKFKLKKKETHFPFGIKSRKE